MNTIWKLFCSLMTAASIAWLICCWRWLETDTGVLRFRDSRMYLLLALCGIIWLGACLWVLLTKSQR